MSLLNLAKQSGDAIAIHYVHLDDLEDTFLNLTGETATRIIK